MYSTAKTSCNLNEMYVVLPEIGFLISVTTTASIVYALRIRMTVFVDQTRMLVKDREISLNILLFITVVQIVTFLI